MSHLNVLLPAIVASIDTIDVLATTSAEAGQVPTAPGVPSSGNADLDAGLRKLLQAGFAIGMALLVGGGIKAVASLGWSGSSPGGRAAAIGAIVTVAIAGFLMANIAGIVNFF